jgi:hypothetical protein
MIAAHSDRLMQIDVVARLENALIFPHVTSGLAIWSV